LTVVILGLAAFSLYLHYHLLPYADDDAYIHMRVARNLWNAGAPYFNRTEAVMASTSPLWVLLTAPAAAFVDFQPLVVTFLNALALVGAALSWALLYGQLTQSRHPREAVATVVVVFFTLVPSSIGLMETPLALLLVGWGLLGIARGSILGVPLLCASAFARPECAAFAISGVLWKIVHKRPWSAREISLSVALLGALSWFQINFFGGLYPHTAGAKEIVYNLTGAEFVRLLFIGSYGGWVAKAVIPAVILAACIMAVVITLRQKRISVDTFVREARSSPLLVILIPSVAILAVYALKLVLIFPWYAPLFLVPFHVALVRDLFRRSGQARLLAMTLLIPWFAVAVCMVIGTRNLAYLPFFESGARARKLRHLGEWLALEHPGAKVAAPEIGALGFSFPGYIEDTVGLASPGALRFHPLKVPSQRPTGYHGGVPAALIDQSRPEIVIGLDVLMTDFLNSSAASRYEIRKVPPVLEEDRARLGTSKVFGADALIIAIRRGS
jgi:hypothetical protein